MCFSVNAPLKAVGVEKHTQPGDRKAMTVTGEVQDETAGQAIFSLFNLGCSSCSRVIERKLKKLAGIKNVTVNYVTDTVFVGYDPRLLSTEQIRASIRKLGYEARVKH